MANTNSKKQNKILLIAGLHGNEPLGLNVAKKLENMNLDWLDIIYGNPKAIEKNERFIDKDLNRVFPGNEKGCYEEERAFEIMQITAKNNYDYVLDFHNTYCSNNDCGFVGGNDYEKTLKLASFLGLNRVIVADYDCVNKYVPKCLSIEISLDSSNYYVDTWIDRLLNLEYFDESDIKKIPELYRFVYRITLEDAEILDLERWKAFDKISNDQKSNLKIDQSLDYYPIFINDKFTPYNKGGLITKLRS